MYNRDSRLMRKLLGKTAPDNAADTTSASGLPVGHTSAPTSSPSAGPPHFRPAVSRNAVYPAGVPIQCIDASPDKHQAVLAGGHVLKTVTLSDGGSSAPSIGDGFDVRAVISAHPASAKKTGSSLADQLSIKDVKWHGDSTIFTACSNGKIFSYDVARISSGVAFDFVQTWEDERQINTLDINPHRGSILLSGSQDGIVRSFDIRQPQQSRNGSLTFRQLHFFKGNADGVRHVQWSPKDGFIFACGTEAGSILKWDIRRQSGPILRINGHENACSSIAWHPDGNHLMSAGWDAKCHVWDFTRYADKRQKAKWTIATPAPVSAIAWRPGLWSATAQGKRVAQVAVSYDDSSQKRHGINAVHIWDLARPTMPYKEIERFDTPPASLLWKDQDVLWTAGRDGFFNQCDVAAAPRVIDRLALSSMSFSSNGHVMMFLDQRPHHRPRRAPQPAEGLRRSSTYGSSTSSTPVLSVSRSDSEEDVLGTFIGHRRRLQRKRRASTRSVPPTSNLMLAATDDVLPLDQAMNATGIYWSQQAMAFGRVPASTKVNVYHFMSTNYLEILEKELPQNGRPLVERLATIMEQFARLAENASLFRLAQTWRILAFTVHLLLERRGQYHLEKRLGLIAEPPSKIRGLRKSQDGNDEDTPKRPQDGRSLQVRSLLSEEIESTSNVPTPLVRPVEDEYVRGKRLTPVLESESFTLGPAVHAGFPGSSPRRRLDSVMSYESGQTQVSSTDGYDFYDTEALSRAIDVPAARQRSSPDPPLDYGPRTPNTKRTVLRQDSAELMFSISASTKHSGPSTVRRISNTLSDGDEVFQSRIRGQALEESPVRRKHPAALHDSPEEVFLISQTTVGTDTTTQSQDSGQGSMPSLQTQSGAADSFSAAMPSGSVIAPTPRSKPLPPAQDKPQTVTENDYFPWPNDPPYPQPLVSLPALKGVLPPPTDPYTVISRAVQFETRNSALHASAMVLLLKPLVPSQVIDPVHATSILRTHHARLMSMKLFAEAAHLRNLCVQGWPEGMPTWGSDYSSLFASLVQLKGKIAFLCPRCKKPRERDPKQPDTWIWRCDRCAQTLSPCAVCGHRDGAPPEFGDEGDDGEDEDDEGQGEKLATWWYCPLCAHGGHASCLTAWHAQIPHPGVLAPGETALPLDAVPSQFGGGVCPFDGCGHACFPGPQASAARSEAVAEVSSKASAEQLVGHSTAVRTDANDVPQSKAVESVRKSLDGKGSGMRSGGAGILSSSPGSRERERRNSKSVKFAGT